MDRYGLRTVDNARVSIELAEQGVPVTAIAARCGMTASAFKRWRDAEPDLEAALQVAYARHVEKLAGNVNQAADRGDARAAQWMLERNPLSKGDFGNAGNRDKGSLHVIINVPRAVGELPSVDEPIILDGKSEDVDADEDR